MKTKLKMRCPGCGCWNTVPADKILLEQRASDGTALAFTSDLSVRSVTSTNVYVTGVNFTAENVGTQRALNFTLALQEA